jgi:hypothetical protein
MNSALSDFVELPFPDDGDIVYVLCFVRTGQTDCVPVYVGESSRHFGRFGDYVSGQFSAPTDFKVGEAIKWLRERDYRVIIKYKESTSRREEEASLIASLKGQPLTLLNDLKGYNYRSAHLRRMNAIECAASLKNWSARPRVPLM